MSVIASCSQFPVAKTLDCSYFCVSYPQKTNSQSGEIQWHTAQEIAKFLESVSLEKCPVS